ncbi:oxalate:formate antiporter [Candidatus Palauibacter sp.]|uniref:oxalate:formate antiporter n=1 Tax=Candidatus Palauibacter sp. TaxID=3101350 RepID=UPI003B51AD7C
MGGREDGPGLRDRLRSLPARHRTFLERALAAVPGVEGVVGLAAGGSFIAGEIDAFSDLDLVLAVEPEAWPAILDRRQAVAAALDPSFLAGFTGEHVGEPRLLVCLYGPPLLHVDLKFVSLDDVHERVEDPVILWERDGRLSAAFARAEARYPAADPAWIEARFWIWAHYIADKIERGEIFEALDGLTLLRAAALAPLAFLRAGAHATGVRRVEDRLPAFATDLQRTVGGVDAAACAGALEAAVGLYTELRAADDQGSDGAMSDVECKIRNYVAGLRDRLQLRDRDA